MRLQFPGNGLADTVWGDAIGVSATYQYSRLAGGIDDFFGGSHQLCRGHQMKTVQIIKERLGLGVQVPSKLCGSLQPVILLWINKLVHRRRIHQAVLHKQAPSLQQLSVHRAQRRADVLEKHVRRELLAVPARRSHAGDAAGNRGHSDKD
ncbi:UNVERIFIED_CONTAM: hypothetical protein ACS92_06040 [Bacillus cereus]